MFPIVESSAHAKRTLHPIIELSDKVQPSTTCKKPFVRLSQGDPCVNPSLHVPETQVEDLIRVIREGTSNGYPPAIGYDESRDAVAAYWSANFVSPGAKQSSIKGSNVVLASGGSHAIVMAITAICDAGDNLLIPVPGFSHYKTVCDSYGIHARSYQCIPERNWEIDIDSLAGMVDSKTKGIVINNPSNPCGSNFSRAHVEAIVRKAEELKLPIISDEIYAEVVLYNEVFVSVADIDTHVPRMVLGGTAKNLVCPGWRIAWLILVDEDNVAAAWLKGCDRLSQLLAGPNSLVQQALPNALTQVPPSHREKLIQTLEAGAAKYEQLADPANKTGLHIIAPRAAMYVMVGINVAEFRDIKDDMDFYEKLIEEENMQVMPGSVFGYPNYFRGFTAPPPEVLDEAIARLIAFCQRHLKE